MSIDSKSPRKRVLIIQGHPDSSQSHFCHALADAYSSGADVAGHEVRRIDIARLDFRLLGSKDEWENGAVPPSLAEPQRAIAWADHIVIFFPLWLGSMPALVKGFFEQTLRPGFAFEKGASGKRWATGLSGKTARVVVTMGMPALLFRLYFCSHGVRSFERNVLEFCGIRPVLTSMIGMVEAHAGARRRKWLKVMWAHGERAR
ncbi:MAG: NAD(P)H-dependent oxidoreductase [Pseudomonadota bacterium]|nr:NAD(P)H-dependent oxidoreductase [Pseudomonadota bacterium]